MPTPRLRLATPDDAAAIARIYAHYVDRTAVTFETEAPSPTEMARRIAATLGPYPYLVAETAAGEVVGYAFAVQHMARAAYAWNAVLSIFLDANRVGSGLGRPLYQALLDILKLQGYHNAYGIITSTNVRSVRFHESLGFTHAGTLQRSGYKHGQWWSIHWYEKRLVEDPNNVAPSPPRSISELPAADLNRSLGD